MKRPLEHANHILSTFTPVRLYADPSGHLWVVGPPIRTSGYPHARAYVLHMDDGKLPRRCFRARVARSGFLGFDYGQLGMGGTQSNLVASLVDWVRGKGDGKPQLWRYAMQDNVRGANNGTLELLERYGIIAPSPPKEGAA